MKEKKAAPLPSAPRLLKAYFEGEDFKAALGRMVTAATDPERLCKVVLAAANRNPDLQECSLLSIAQCVMDAAEVGLEPGISVLSHAYLIPYWNKDNGCMEAQFQVSYKGKMELARRSGIVQRIEARVVYAHDDFKIRGGTDPGIRHTWDMALDRGPQIGCYAVAFYKDGSKQFADMSIAEVERIRQTSSKAPDSPAWKKHFAEMSLAKVCHRLEKMLPLSIHQQRAHDHDEEEGDIVQGKVVTEPAAENENAKSENGSKNDKKDVPEKPAEKPRSRALAAAQEQATLDLDAVKKKAGGRETVPANRSTEAPVPAVIVPEPPPAEYQDPGPCPLKDRFNNEPCNKPAGHEGQCSS